MKEVDIRIERTPFRRGISIVIANDNTIVVKAAKSTPVSAINDFLNEKRGWIEKTVLFNVAVRRPYRENTLADGELLRYLGDDYPLIHIPSDRDCLEFSNGSFFLHLSDSVVRKRPALKSIVEAWYRNAASQIISERVSYFAEKTGLVPGEIKIKSYKRTWGNCESSGILTFSWKLVMAPLDIIDYVVVHELCHLRHMNHSKAFWSEVAGIIKEYKQRREWLKIHEAELEL